MLKIGSFDGPNRFLSNFYPSDVLPYLKGIPRDQIGCVCLCPTVEHAYQAAKTVRQEERATILAAKTPAEAKKLGRYVTLRQDWETIRLLVMEDLVRQKFSNHPGLKVKLLATGEALLLEGNYWGDRYWGICRGVGENHLGKILMKVRAELTCQ